MHLIAALFDGNTGNGLVVETYLGRVEITNSRFVDNHGNGVKAKFLDGRFVIVDQLLTFCKMANIGTQSFPQLITGIPAFSTSCQRVRRLTDAGIALGPSPVVYATLRAHSAKMQLVATDVA